MSGGSRPCSSALWVNRCVLLPSEPPCAATLDPPSPTTTTTTTTQPSDCVGRGSVSLQGGGGSGGSGVACHFQMKSFRGSSSNLTFDLSPPTLHSPPRACHCHLSQPHQPPRPHLPAGRGRGRGLEDPLSLNWRMDDDIGGGWGSVMGGVTWSWWSAPQGHLASL